MISFHALREEEIPLAKALKVESKQVTKADSYARWSQSTRISNSPLEQLRLLNDDYPQGELTVGEWAKLVR
jgi:predicted Zn-dependent protease